MKQLIEWVCFPMCGSKTRIKIRSDTELTNFPLYCPKCKREALIKAKDLQVNRHQRARRIRRRADEQVSNHRFMVEQGIHSLDKEEVQTLLNEILENLITDKNIDKVIDYLKKYVAHIESFSLEFNINNKEGSSGSAIYKSVGTLSLGQKVVAMLAFILGYSEYSKDYRPLIIDQPEDNLDN